MLAEDTLPKRPANLTGFANVQCKKRQFFQNIAALKISNVQAFFFDYSQRL
jgi:hypothetical protein